MTTPDYTAFDAALLEHIKFGRTVACQLECKQDLMKLAAAHPSTLGRPLFRVIDGRLQALRRKGVITYDRKAGWQVVEGKA